MSIASYLYENSLSDMLCVDPGENTGWAYFKSTIGERYSIDHGVFTPHSIKGESQKHTVLVHRFKELLEKYNPDLIYIESVSFWAGSDKSSASVNSGAIFKLDRVVGGYMAVCSLMGFEYELLPANVWKGQMNKATTKLRLQRALPKLTIKNNHTIDAIAMGLSLGGDL